MIYPDFLKPGDTIGICAPSDGNSKDVDIHRLENGIATLERKGFHVYETASVRKSEKGRSASKEQRAKEFMELIEAPHIKTIVSAKGGDFMCEMLSLIDFDSIKQNPKWYQGYSDNTCLTFTITTLCDIATIYGNNFNDFGMEEWHSSVQNDFKLLTGNCPVQNHFDWHEDAFHDKITGLESYAKDKKVCWKSEGNQDVTIEGRLLGGCLDVLLDICGTRFDGVKEFLDRYYDDKIVWYLESFALSSEALTRGLWRLKEAGWFKNVAGFVFGRPCFFSTETDTTYEEAVTSVLSDFNVPILYDVDIGHKGPQFAVVNGAYGCFTYKKSNEEFVGSLAMKWKA
ncbi:MAG: LD-carboxypeptidase [Lachnospiraceae bacterium]|nr:LD-carboxypeptidase [Lachnospiraceae bacterium]